MPRALLCTSCGVAVLLFSIAFLHAWWPDSAFSPEEIHAVYADVQSQYEELHSSKDRGTDWEAFESATQARLAPLLEELERSMPTDSPELRLYYQVGKYEIPRVIRGRTAWEIPRMEQARYLWAERPRESEVVDVPWVLDPVILLMGLLDVVVVVWIVRVNRRWHWERRLHYLDRKFAKQPDSVKYRSQRARLRATLGDREGALSDIAWLMERAPPGVDLKSLGALRDSLGEP